MRPISLSCRILCSTLFLLLALPAGAMAATCIWSLPQIKPLPPSFTAVPPTLISLKRVQIGQVMASMDVPFNVPNYHMYTCSEPSPLISYKVTPTVNLQPSGIQGVWQTNIPGVGVALYIKSNPSLGGRLPFSFSPALNSQHYVAWSTSIDFIRTDVGVTAGKQTFGFNIDFVVPGFIQTKLIVQETLIDIENEAYFSSCETVDTKIEVPMGKETIANIRKGTVQEHPFKFDIRCMGLKPNAQFASARAYFEGDKQADGLLRLKAVEESAKGVGIALTNDKGVKLPFTKSGAVGLDWNRSDARGEIYRFSGTAKYAPTTGEMEPGKGDATMSFVIDYN
ncbi:Fimbrial protein [compost metagenome]